MTHSRRNHSKSPYFTSELLVKAAAEPHERDHWNERMSRWGFDEAARERVFEAEQRLVHLYLPYAEPWIEKPLFTKEHAPEQLPDPRQVMLSDLVRYTYQADRLAGELALHEVAIPDPLFHTLLRAGMRQHDAQSAYWNEYKRRMEESHVSNQQAQQYWAAEAGRSQHLPPEVRVTKKGFSLFYSPLPFGVRAAYGIKAAAEEGGAPQKRAGDGPGNVA